MKLNLNLKPIHVRRLRKIIKHLRQGKLGHKTFDFSLINSTPLSLVMEGEPNYDDRGCGTNGCAIGELPFIFPRDWTYRRGPTGFWSAPVRTGDQHRLPFRPRLDESIARFLGITEYQVGTLFYPAGYRSADYECGIECQLPETATRKQVARNIEKFLAWAAEPRKKVLTNSDR
jgi:hypothetical protein